jgi:hypothetical protein
MGRALAVISEREGDRSWIFELADANGAPALATMTLAWADYDWWSPDGRDTPSTVALAVATVFQRSLDAVDGSPLPAHFDASIVRRRIGGGDELISRELGRGR